MRGGVRPLGRGSRSRAGAVPPAVTPNVGFGMSDGGARDWRLGWRLTPAASDGAGFEVNLDAMRREPANGDEAESALMLKGAIAW